MQKHMHEHLNPPTHKGENPEHFKNAIKLYHMFNANIQKAFFFLIRKYRNLTGFDADVIKESEK